MDFANFQKINWYSSSTNKNCGFGIFTDNSSNVIFLLVGVSCGRKVGWGVLFFVKVWIFYNQKIHVHLFGVV